MRPASREKPYTKHFVRVLVRVSIPLAVFARHWALSWWLKLHEKAGAGRYQCKCFFNTPASRVSISVVSVVSRKLPLHREIQRLGGFLE